MKNNMMTPPMGVTTVLAEKAADTFITLASRTLNLTGRSRELLDALRPDLVQYFEDALYEADNPGDLFPRQAEATNQ